MHPLSVVDEWGPLREVVLGEASSLYFPDPHPIDEEGIRSPWIRACRRAAYNLVAGRRVPEWLRRRHAAELNRFNNILVGRGVAVHRPQTIKPLAGEPRGLGQMFARDPIFVVGDTLVVGRLQMELRQKEIRGLHWIIAKAKRQGTKVAQLNDPAAFLEGGDVIVDWPRVYVGIGKYASNRQGAAWLQGVLGSEAEVIPVALSDPGILHLDCCMTLIGPRRGIIHRPSLRHPLPAPLGEYDFIEIDGRTRRELGSNVLVLDPGAIALQARHAALAAALAQKRYEVIPLGFTFHAGLGGAFRCATAPLRRASA